MDEARYDRIAIILHWAIGLALIGQILFGYLLDDLAPRGTPARATVINLHKSFGIVLGLLVIVRLGWRLRHRPPAWPASMAAWQQRAALWGHRALYACMLLMPLSGYTASNFSKHGVRFFGMAWKPWGPDLPAVYGFFNGLHEATGFAFTVLIAGHVLAALKHAFVDRDEIFARMRPARGSTLLAASTLAASTLLAAALAWPHAARAAPFAYVPNEGSGTLSVIDTATDQVVATIPAGKKPRGTVIAPDGARAYVSDQPGNRLVVVDLAARKAVGAVALGESPEGVGMSPDGRWVAAAVEGTNDVAFVDTQGGTLAFVVKVRGRNPEHAVFSPDGTRVFVSAEEGEAVDVIDVARRAQVAQVPVGARPRGIGFSPDGKRAYVAAENANEVYVIDAVENEVLARVKAGSRSNGIAVHPDGRRVFVSNGGEASVSVLDTQTLAVTATIPVGQRPWNMALTPDGRKLYVACGRSGAVSVIDLERNARIADVPVGRLPWGVVIR